MIKKKKISIISCFLMCLFIFLIYVVLGTLTYESDDDEVMNLIAAGAFGSKNRTYLVFSNVIYGKLISFLYGVFPKLNMYLFLMLFLNFAAVYTLSYMAVSRVTLRLENSDKALKNIDYALISAGISFAVSSFLATEYYCSLQFSKNAGLYTAVGFAVLYAWYKEKKTFKNPVWILGVLFLWLGFAVRDYAFLSSALECMTILFGLFLLNIKSHIISFKEKKMGIFKENYRLIIMIVVSVLGIGMLKVVNDKAYSKTEWKDFLEFNRYRAELTDYSMPDFYANYEALEEIDFDLVDYYLFNSWAFADNDKFNTDTLKKLVEIRGNDSKKLTLNIKKILISITEFDSKSTGRFICIFWIFILLFLCFAAEGKNILLFGISTAGILAEYWYLSCVGRVIWRAEMMVWIAAIVVFLTVFSYESDYRLRFMDGSDKFRRFCVALALFCMMFVKLGRGVYNFAAVKGRHFYVQSTVKYDMYTGLDKDNLYIFTLNVTGPTVVDDIAKINCDYDDYFYNVSFCGGWTVSSPLQKNVLEKYGVDNNVFTSLVTNDKVYLVDNSNTYQLIEKYLDKKFNNKVTVKKVGTVNGNDIYDFELME
ncbi:MAG: hypothetical protein IJ167_06610 [Lachnospiraceae bacterium]|nr:hypothetical protein [Lachnospiraceae bacterium]